LELSVKAAAPGTGQKLLTALEQPEIGEGTKQGIDALLGSLVEIAPA